MPQANAYPLQTSLLSADTVLFWQDSSGTVNQITGQNLADSLDALRTGFLALLSISSNTTLDETAKLVVGNSGSGITATLPDATANEGQEIRFYNRGAGTLTIQRAGSDTVGSGTSIALAQYEGAILISVGTGMWAVVAAS